MASGWNGVAPGREGRILRVQVKSTILKRRGEGYSLNVMGAHRERYPRVAAQLDCHSEQAFFAQRGIWASRAKRRALCAIIARLARFLIELSHYLSETVVDFLAVYLIPIDAWYIIPFELMGRTNCRLHFTPDRKRHKYAAYREAWHLLRGEGAKAGV
jgi:hypothetical protein